MNLNTPPAQTPNQNRPPDLIVVPQKGLTLPNSDLPPFEQEAVQHDWAQFGHTPTIDNPDTWLIQIWHIKNGTPRPTSTLTLPKQTTQPAQRPATHADNAASTLATSAPQSAE